MRKKRSWETLTMASIALPAFALLPSTPKSWVRSFRAIPWCVCGIVWFPSYSCYFWVASDPLGIGAKILCSYLHEHKIPYLLTIHNSLKFESELRVTSNSFAFWSFSCNMRMDYVHKFWTLAMLEIGVQNLLERFLFDSIVAINMAYK